MAENKPNDALRKLQQAEDAKKARAEYEKAGASVEANTARLRALRLEREAAAAAAAPPKPVSKLKGKASKKAKAATGTLSDWLKDRQSSGHNN